MKILYNQLFFFLLFSMLKNFSFNYCLFSQISLKENCHICDFDSYNENILYNNDFNINNCKNKNSEEIFLDLNIYITNNRTNSLYFDGSIKNPYNTLISALKEQSLLRMKEKYKNNSQLTFKLFKGVHLILENDITFYFINFFRRIFLSIKIEPVFCNEINEIDICYDLNLKEMVKIIIYSQKFNFFISKKLELNSVSFEYFNGNVKNIRSFFNIESIIDKKNEFILVELITNNVEFLNFELENINLINIDLYSNYRILINNSKINNCKFLNGIFGLYDPYDSLIKNTNIDYLYNEKNFNFIDIVYSIFNNLNKNSLDFFIKLNNFIGFFNFISNIIENCTFTNYGFINIESKFGFYFEIKLNSNIFQSNNFSNFIKISRNYIKTGSKTIIVSNILINNTIYNYFGFKFNDFTLISGIFDDLRLPFNSFIISEFTNLTLNSCIFKNLNFATKEINPIYLIIFASIFETPQTIIFSTANKNNLYYTNDTLIIFNCSFENNNNIQFFKNIYVSYFIDIRNTIFNNIHLDDLDNSFFFFIPEKMFVIENCIFNQIKTKTKLINIYNFLEILISKSLFHEILIENDKLIYINSYVPTLMSHRLQLIYTSFQNISILVESILSNILYIQSQTGSGPFMNYSSVFFRNISVNQENKFHGIIRVAGLGILMEKITIMESENFILFQFNPKDASSFLNVSSFVTFNLKKISAAIITDANLNIFSIKNSVFIQKIILFQNCISIFWSNFLIGENLIIEAFSAVEGSLLYFQISNSVKLYLNQCIFRNYKDSFFNSIRISTSSKTIVIPVNLREFDPNFGILNSIFQSSYRTLIIILPNSMILLKNCTITNIFSQEAGLILLMELSIVFLLNCSIINSVSKSSGGTFYSDNSNIFLFNVNIFGSHSFDNGGLGILINSNSIFLDCEFKNMSSKSSGGSFIGSDSKIKIENCTFYEGRSYFFGGFIYCKNCYIIIEKSNFISGISDYYGSCFFLENSFYEISNSIIKNSIGKMGVIYIAGKHNNDSSINKCMIKNNMADFKLFFISDNILKMEDCFFKDNIVIDGEFYESYGFSLKINIELKNNFFLDNFSKLYFNIENAICSFRNVSFLNNINLIDIFKFLEVDGFLVSFLNIIDPMANIGNSVVFMEKSNFFIDNSKFILKSRSNAIYLIESEIILHNTLFFEGLGSYGGALKLYFSVLFGEGLIFSECEAFKGGSIYSENSKIYLNSSYFYNNSADNSASDIGIYNYNQKKDINITLISNCEFTGFFKRSMHIIANQIIIKNIHSFGFLSRNSSQAIFFERSENISILNSNFMNIFKQSMILIKKLSSLNSLDLYIKNNNFTFGSGDNGSFIKLEGKIKIYLEKNSFINGESEFSGGAIYYLCESDCYFESKNNKFINNIAGLNGGAIKIDSKTLFLSKNDQFLNNTALFSEDISSFPENFIILISQNILEMDELYEYIKNMKNVKNLKDQKLLSYFTNNTILTPGHKYHIIVILIDFSLNIIKLESETKLIIESNDISVQLHNNLAVFNQGIAHFYDFKILGNQNSSTSFKFSYNSNYFPPLRINFNSIYLNYCQKGESYFDQGCVKCPLDQFSLVYTPKIESCQSCPMNSICNGGFEINPNLGYWRKNENSSLIIKCLNDDACQVQNFTNFINFECGTGYKGNLCYYCEEEFGNIYLNCIKCSENQLFIFISYACGYIFSLSYTLFMENHKSGNDDFIMLNKLLVNHFSVFIVLGALKVQWQNFLKNLLFLTINYFSIFSPFVFSTDCFIKIHDLNLNTIIIGISPFYLVICSIFFRYIMELIFLINNYRKKKIDKIEMKKTLKKYYNLNWLFSISIKYLIIIYLGLYTNLLNSLIKLFGCRNLDNSSITYMYNFPEYECYNKNHYIFLIIGFIFILIWAFVFPLIVLIIVNKNKQQRNKKEFFLNYMIKGYKDKFYYWDIVILFRKLLSILITISSENMDISSIGGILIIIFFVFLILNVKLEPQEKKSIGKFENTSIYVTIISIGFGIITNFKDTSENFKFFLYFGMISINILFFATLIFSYIRIFFRILKKVSSSLKIYTMKLKRKNIQKKRTHFR